MNIGVFESETHFDSFYRFAKIAAYGGANVTLFCSRDVYENASVMFGDDSGNFKWVIKTATESRKGFLKSIERYCRDHNIHVLLVNTFSNNFPNIQYDYFLFHPSCKTVLVCNRIEEWLGEAGPIKFKSPKEFILSIMKKTSQLIRARTLSKFDAIIVETPAAMDYAIAADYTKPLFQMPYAFFNERITTMGRTDKLNFVVPGGVVCYRRDYHGLLDVFEKLHASGRIDIRLSLLGSPRDRRKEGLKVLERCKKLNDRGLDINFYTDFVPEEVFAEEMILADIIIDPLRVGFHGTVSSGAVIRAIQFAKPAIYPANTLMHEKLISSSLFYKKIHELYRLICDLCDDPKLLPRLSENALINSQKFSLDKVSKRFQEFITNLVD